jgi:hypothetical protein
MNMLFRGFGEMGRERGRWRLDGLEKKKRIPGWGIWAVFLGV